MDINFTINLMKKAHFGQIDKGGEEYWKHPYQVFLNLKNLNWVSDNVLHAALLHDVIEDTEITLDDIKNYGYSNEICEILSLLTRDKTTGLTYIEWIRSICESENYDAILIKYYDNRHNASQDRINKLSEEEKSIINRYERAAKILRFYLNKGKNEGKIKGRY